jgi:hypothetical protein
MDSAQGTCGFAQVGFPIRKSPDQRSFSSSPRLIAAIHVLHRLLVPRHPPCALVLLISPNTFSENTTYRYAVLKVRASSSPQCESLPVRPTAMKVGPPATRGVIRLGPVSQSSTARLLPELHTRVRWREGKNRRGVNVISRRAPSTRRPHSKAWNGAGRYVRRASRDGLRRIEIHRIPRKEVIQPQLPLRLPCYDFTPVTNSTFDCSLPYGLGHRLRVSPASVV